MPKRRTTAKKTAEPGKTTDYLINLAFDSVLDTDPRLPIMRSYLLRKQELTNGHYLMKHYMDGVLGDYGPFNVELLQTFPINQLSEEEYFKNKELASNTTFLNLFTNELLLSIPDDLSLNQNERLSVALLKMYFQVRVDSLIKVMNENASKWEASRQS
jgi:hypothetical protein